MPNHTLMLRKHTILVTGGAGYVGSHAAVALLSAGHDVVVFDNFSNGSPLALTRVEEICGRTFEVIQGDIRDHGALEGALTRFRCDAVMHFAAIGRRDQLTVFGEDYESPDGTGRNYFHVMNLAEGHVVLGRAGCFAINLGSGTGHSVLEVIHAFEQASKRPVPYKIAPRRPGDLDAYYAATRMARETLGGEPRCQIAPGRSPAK